MLANNLLNCDGSWLRLEDKHIVCCVDGDKCGMFYILLAIDVVTSDLFGVPHTESRGVECNRYRSVPKYSRTLDCEHNPF
jgi:hypothetical protein